MKDKILFLIIGILIGAIITTGGFLIYNKTVEKDFNQHEMMRMNDNGQMEQPEGNMGEPPEKPSDDNGEEPLEKFDNTSDNANI